VYSTGLKSRGSVGWLGILLAIRHGVAGASALGGWKKSTSDPAGSPHGANRDRWVLCREVSTGGEKGRGQAAPLREGGTFRHTPWRERAAEKLRSLSNA